MKTAHLHLCIAILVTASIPTLRAQDSLDGLWKAVPPAIAEAAPRAEGNRVQPDAFRLVTLNAGALKEILRRAPLENTVRGAARAPGVESVAKSEITIPTPDGKFLRVRIYEAQIMEPALAAKVPELKAYRGEVIENPSASVQINMTPDGFRAQVLSPDGAFYVDPSGRADEYKCYFRRDHRKRSAFQCLVPGKPDPAPGVARREAEARPVRSGQGLRTYRLAVACTGEYARFHGGTMLNALTALVATVDRVNGVYETELAVRLILVGNNDQLIFTDPNADGLTNNDAEALIDESQATIDRIIRDANYDIGHTFSTGAGGLAGLGVVCRAGEKGRGVTGTDRPIGDPFDVDFVAHEMGHQFGGDHTFNGARGSCSGRNRNGPTAFEPGSGTTIQAYAGICGNDDVQLNSSPYFHCESLDQIIRYTTLGAGNVPQPTPTGNNPPTVDAGPDRIIPKGTPFVLTANGSDADGDRLTFCWEQRDLGPQSQLEAPDDGRIPLFRSAEPSVAPERHFPRLPDLLNNISSNVEKLPTLARTMNFRVTARDNRGNGGGVNGDDVQVRVHAAAGPFKLRSPNAAGSLSGAVTVTWDVAGTNAAPINASRVNILLSVDGGQSFRETLAAATPNDGSQAVMLPNAPTSTARIKIEAADNVFFDVSDANFTIAAAERAVVVAAVEENAGREQLAGNLDSVSFDAIYAVGAGASRKLADAVGEERGIPVIGNVEQRALLESIQRNSGQRRVLLVVPRSEVGAVTQTLGLTAAPAGPVEAASSIDVFTAGLTEKAGELRRVQLPRR